MSVWKNTSCIYHQINYITMNKQYQAKLTLEGTAEQIEHTLLAIARTLQVQRYYYPEIAVNVINAPGYEDILIESELKKV